MSLSRCSRLRTPKLSSMIKLMARTVSVTCLSQSVTCERVEKPHGSIRPNAAINTGGLDIR